MKKEILITLEGLEKLKEELDELRTNKRVEINEALKEARALGDLSENAEYDAAREAQAINEARIKELENIVDNAKIIKEKNTDKVDLGTKVTILYMETSEEEQYFLVGSTEADPFANKISNESPLAQAIMHKKEGDVATVSSNNGSYQIKILEIA